MKDHLYLGINWWKSDRAYSHEKKKQCRYEILIDVWNQNVKILHNLENANQNISYCIFTVYIPELHVQNYTTHNCKKTIRIYFLGKVFICGTIQTKKKGAAKERKKIKIDANARFCSQYTFSGTTFINLDIHTTRTFHKVSK